MRKSYEIFSTTADVGIRIRGKDCAQLWRNALLALNELAFGRRLQCPAGGRVRLFQFQGDSCEHVLVNLLAEALFQMFEKKRAVADIEFVEAQPERLRARLRLVPWPRPPIIEIKSVTYHNLRIVEENGQLRADVVFDV